MEKKQRGTIYQTEVLPQPCFQCIWPTQRLLPAHISINPEMLNRSTVVNRQHYAISLFLLTNPRTPFSVYLSNSLHPRHPFTLSFFHISVFLTSELQPFFSCWQFLLVLFHLWTPVLFIPSFLPLFNRSFLFNKEGNPNKRNVHNETCLHVLCQGPQILLLPEGALSPRLARPQRDEQRRADCLQVKTRCMDIICLVYMNTVYGDDEGDVYKLTQIFFHTNSH